MKIIITHFNRPEFLKQQLNEFKGYDVTVIDDGSKCDLSFVPKLIKFPHLGKKGFWIIWKKVLQVAKESKHERILITPDDFINFDLERIHQLDLDNKVYNIINDGRTINWGCKSYVDCGIVCNKKSLENIVITEPPINWFNRENKSSSVGYQLTKQFDSQNIEMIIPTKSFAYHGNHDSMMHPTERKNNPLISI
jgi:hypothetical protein